GKILPHSLVRRILERHAAGGLTSVVVGDQSCALTRLLGSADAPIPNVEALAATDAREGRNPSRCLGLCPPGQLVACNAPPPPTADQVQAELDHFGAWRGTFAITGGAVVLTGSGL